MGIDMFSENSSLVLCPIMFESGLERLSCGVRRTDQIIQVVRLQGLQQELDGFYSVRDKMNEGIGPLWDRVKQYTCGSYRINEGK